MISISTMQLDPRHWARVEPARVAVQMGGATLTYAGLEAQSNQLARVFRERGLQPGEHVAGLLRDGPFALVVAWAAWRSGVYLTPVSTALSAPDAAYIVANCLARLVIVDVRYTHFDVWQSARTQDGLHWFSHGGACDGGEGVAGGEGRAGWERIEAAMAAQSGLPRAEETPGGLMMYTSGTTGAPKGVLRPLPPASFRGTAPFAADLIALFRLDATVRYLSTAPLYHAAPLRFALAVTAAGGTVVALDGFDAELALHALETCAITHSQWVPSMFQRLLKLPDERRARFRAPAHRVALHAAAPCPRDLKRAMIGWWGPILLEYYSGTEGIGLTMIDSHEWCARPGSVGRAVKGIPHVVDAEGRELSAGEVGEIFFSGIPPFQYFGDQGKTGKRTHALGWQTLGDVGYLDDAGYLYLTDRLDDMIISGGVNVYPQEIEEAIRELPEVLDCAVVGVADASFGERPIAFLVGKAGIAPDALIELTRAHCAERLGRIKRPDRFVAVSSVPRSATGKLLRRQLRSCDPHTKRPEAAPDMPK